MNSYQDRKGLTLSLKGQAVLAAIACGLCPKSEHGYDDANFNAFWDIIGAELEAREKSYQSTVCDLNWKVRHCKEKLRRLTTFCFLIVIAVIAIIVATIIVIVVN